MKNRPVRAWTLGFLLGAMLGLWHNPVFAQETHLTLLHSNDMAGRFEQILKAGAIKKQIEQTQRAVLLLDAGNTMTGFEGAFVHGARQGSPTVMFLGRAGYDAWVPGQRELGLSLDLLTGFMRKAAFPVLGANLHRLQTGRFLFQVQPYALIRTGGIRVGVLGLSQASTGIWQGDPVLAAQYYVPILRQQADVLVVLTHQDYAVDSTLAVAVEGIDVIVGTYSEQVGLREVNGVQIRQAGTDGQFLGRIDLTLVGGRVRSATGQLIPLEEPGPDGADAMLADWTLPVQGSGADRHKC